MKIFERAQMGKCPESEIIVKSFENLKKNFWTATALGHNFFQQVRRETFQTPKVRRD